MIVWRLLEAVLCTYWLVTGTINCRLILQRRRALMDVRSTQLRIMELYERMQAKNAVIQGKPPPFRHRGVRKADNRPN